MYVRFLKYLLVMAALALLVPVSIFARTRNERNVEFHDAVKVGSALLKAGDYKVEWEGPASSLRVNFLQDGKTVATAEGKMVQKKTPSPYDDVVTTAVQNTNRLEEIDFSGKTQALVFVSTKAKSN